MSDAYKDIENVVGSKFITNKDFMKAAYSRNVDPAFPDRWADMIVRPENSEEISEIVKIANKYKIKVVPRGGGADLVGGAATDGGILLDLTRMNRILEINQKDFYCEVEAGVTWAALLSELYPKGLTTGMVGPGSGFSATMGGGLSNSSAGFGSTKYGLITENCLGVEIVLPNPEGTIIRTGAATSKYAKPFCRYGVAPDFTGLFMGDVGTMGIKTKAFLRLYPNAPYKIMKNYMLNSPDYDLTAELMVKLQMEVRDGIHDLYIRPLDVVQLMTAFVKEKPKKRPKLKGHVFMFILEAFDEKILEIYEEKVENIMKNHSRHFDWNEIDTSLGLSKDTEFNLQFPYRYFNKFISLFPPKISCTTCHKLPISFMPSRKMMSAEFDSSHQNEFPPRSASAFATSIHLLPNGHCVFAGGFNADNTNEQREIAMKMWHKRVRAQVRYGGVHYWLGESISQSIVEAGAYDDNFIKFFKNIKKLVDPNFILSPNKFHMYSYENDINNYIIKEGQEASTHNE
ncbi:MAG: FAD-binding oxidoreductase [Candidatus Lokiarchaeota archaeon]|nr:FAD-binding oxidoreductase [Candidatus Lokiarchaeota archaeon]